MPNSLTARNFELTDDLKSYVEKKVDRLRKIFDNIQKIDVVFVSGKRQEEAELIVQATQGTLKCLAKDQNATAAFDVAMDKMERQLARHKARIVGNKKHNKEAARSARGRFGLGEEAAAAAAESGEPEYDATVVLARSMSVREAIDKFDRDGRQPLVFLDEETGGLHLFYANGDGERRLVEILTED